MCDGDQRHALQLQPIRGGGVSNDDALVRIRGAAGAAEALRIRAGALAARPPVAGAVALADVAGHLRHLDAVAAVQARHAAADVTGAALQVDDGCGGSVSASARDVVNRIRYLQRVLALLARGVAEVGAAAVGARAGAVLDATAVLRLVQFAGLAER